MFTGIIEATGIVEQIDQSGSNIIAWVNSPLSGEFKPDQSVSHNGICLTIEETKGHLHRVTAIEETIQKTNLKNWQKGSIVNLERCLQMNGRLDGHIVQGHIDGTATCLAITEKDGSREYLFEIENAFAGYIIEKGSITLNGISLTIFNVTSNSFMVAIIPYTYKHTNMKQLKNGDTVNIEFDMIGKYVNRYMQLNK